MRALWSILRRPLPPIRMQTRSHPTEADHALAVRSMFAGIASRYDTLNHLLSLNIDKRWRRKVSERISAILADPTAVDLDVACGTGDLTIEMATGAKVYYRALDGAVR